MGFRPLKREMARFIVQDTGLHRFIEIHICACADEDVQCLGYVAQSARFCTSSLERSCIN